MPRPLAGDYAPFLETYVNACKGDDVFSLLNYSWDSLNAWLGTIPEEKLHYAYAEGKWTLAQLLQHLIDTERVFAYRAMCIARGEQKPLPPFDENAYAERGNAAHRSLSSLKTEMQVMRKSTIALFNAMNPEDIAAEGIASNHRITVNALGFIIAGHVYHHQRIYLERYC
ncbi:MAG TPA: DinB family protein [Phnomibacter sp.]|nr:DinB family protein [Phnomibacter sp.]